MVCHNGKRVRSQDLPFGELGRRACPYCKTEAQRNTTRKQLEAYRAPWCKRCILPLRTENCSHGFVSQDLVPGTFPPQRLTAEAESVRGNVRGTWWGCRALANSGGLGAPR